MKTQILDTISNNTATLSSILGAKTTVNYPLVSNPIFVDKLPPSLPIYLEYFLFIMVLIFTVIIINDNRQGFKRLMLPAFSFSSMNRKVESLDRSLDNAAKKSIFLIIFLVIAFAIKDKVFWGIYNNNWELILSAIKSVATALVFLFIPTLITLIFDKKSKHRYFYKRLHILERVQLAGYSLLLIPLNLLMFAASPFRNILALLSIFLLFIYIVHNIIVVSRYFLREKLSYHQLFLYLCTLKAAFIFILLYYLDAVVEIRQLISIDF